MALNRIGDSYLSAMCWLSLVFLSQYCAPQRVNMSVCGDDLLGTEDFVNLARQQFAQ